MKVIHKIELQPGLRTYQLPLKSKLLTAQFQRGQLCLWYERPVESAGVDNRQLLFIGTGQEFSDGHWEHIATTQTLDENFVFHVFELVS